MEERHRSEILRKISAKSLYAFEDTLAEGYITLPGGARVGMGGGFVRTGSGFRILEPTSFCFRIPREVVGCGERVLQRLWQGKQFANTLVISPPGMGKTTLIRDLARLLSEGVPGHRPLSVAVVDTRMEIAAARSGVPQLSVGCRTDVLSGCPKDTGMRIAVRTLAPDVIVCDEIGTEADAMALRLAAVSGVSVLASAHGRDDSDPERNPSLAPLFREGYFGNRVVLGEIPGKVLRISVPGGSA